MRILLVSEGKHEASGALEGLVGRLRADRVQIDQAKVSQSDLRAYHGTGGGYFKRALAWMMRAQKDSYDALILLIDEDHMADRIRQLDAAQEDRHFPVRRALGVAVHTFDAWMLADENALSQALGARVDRQKDPESIAEPKATCAAILTESGTTQTQSEVYRMIAEQAKLQVLEDRCPRGFRPFAKRVRDL